MCSGFNWFDEQPIKIAHKRKLRKNSLEQSIFFYRLFERKSERFFFVAFSIENNYILLW